MNGGLSKKVKKAYVNVGGLSKLFYGAEDDSGLLWNYIDDNNGNILYGRQTYNATLHGAIENYTKLVVEIRSYYINNPDLFVILPVKPLQQAIIPNRTLIGTGKGVWNDRYAVYDIFSTTLNKVKDNYGRYGNSMGLVNVWGIMASMTTSLLWDYATENNGVIPYNPPITLTLRNAIENYDQIVLEIVSHPDNITNQDGTMVIDISVNALQNAYRPNYFNHTSWRERGSVYYMEGTTFRKDVNNIAGTNGIVKIWGIKY